MGSQTIRTEAPADFSEIKLEQDGMHDSTVDVSEQIGNNSDRSEIRQNVARSEIRQNVYRSCELRAGKLF